jgi:hypothetical protein
LGALWLHDRAGGSDDPQDRRADPRRRRRRRVRNVIAVYTEVESDQDYILQHRSADYMGHMRVAGGKLSLDGSPRDLPLFATDPTTRSLGTIPPGYKGYATVTEARAVELVDWAYEDLGDVLAHQPQHAAAIGAALARVEHDGLARRCAACRGALAAGPQPAPGSRPRVHRQLPVCLPRALDRRRRGRSRGSRAPTSAVRSRARSSPNSRRSAAS